MEMVTKWLDSDLILILQRKKVAWDSISWPYGMSFKNVSFLEFSRYYLQYGWVQLPETMEIWEPRFGEAIVDN